MLQFYQKKSWRTIVYSPYTAILLLVVIVFLAQVVYDRYVTERQMAARRSEAEMQLRSLEERRDTLSERVDYLSHERGIEAEMRRNFDIAQPGEKVVIILDDAEVVTPLATSTPDVPPKPWYKFWQ